MAGSPADSNVGAKICWFFAGLGTLLLLGGIGFGMKKQQFLSHAEQTQGTVIGMVQHISNHQGYGHTYAPVFTFHDKTGKEWTVTSGSGSSPPAYHVGESVKVYYSPEKPSDAEVQGFFSLWGGSFIIGIIGLVQLLLGLAGAKAFSRSSNQFKVAAPSS